MTKTTKTATALLAALILFALVGYAGYLWQGKEAESVPENRVMTPQEIAETASEAIQKTGPAVDNEPAVIEQQSSQTADGLGVRAIGNPDAPVRMIEYASLTCNHCASFHLNTLPDLKKRYVESGDLYIQFEEFPLNAPALDASLLARCLPAERYYGFIDLLFKTQESWMKRADYRVALIQNVKLAGLSEEEANACLDNQDLKKALAGRIQKLNEQYQITSTPTFIINEGKEVIRGAKPLYEFERVFRKVSDNKVATIKDPEEEQKE